MHFAVLPFGPFFPDFGPDPDFFQEIGPDMVRICTKKSGFEQKWMNFRLKLIFFIMNLTMK